MEPTLEDHDEDDHSEISSLLPESPNTGQRRQKSKTTSNLFGYLNIIGYGTILACITAAVLAFTGGICIGYCLFLLLQLIDETSFYQILFVKASDNLSDLPCYWNRSGLITDEFNQSEFHTLLIKTSNALTVRALAVLTLHIVCMSASHFLWTTVMLKFTKQFRVGFFSELLERKSMAWYDSHPPGQLASSLSESAVIADRLETNFFIFAEFSGISISCLILSYITHWKLTVILNIGLLIVVSLSFLFLKIATSFSKRTQKVLGNATVIAEELISHIRTVKAFEGEKHGIERYKSCIDAGKSLAMKVNLAIAIAIGLMYLTGASTPALGFWIGLTYFLKSCLITLEQIIMTVILCAAANQTALVSFLSLLMIGNTMGILESIVNIWNKDSIKGQPTFKLTISNGNIEFSNVSFHYPSRTEAKVLKGIDFTIDAGQKLAIVGHSGCGKSTITKLLLGLYECYDGCIKIDGCDIKYIDKQLMRHQIGFVPQEPALFNTTIYENIGYGNLKAKKWEIEEAAKLANAHDFIMRLPDGYQTTVGEGGIQISGGQKQRVAIARALIHNPKILILDEATSALDKENELLVEDALNNAMKGRTTIIIAHRLSTVEKADMIIGIKDGRIVETGSHSELIDKKGLYYELMMKQQNMKTEVQEKFNEIQSYMEGKVNEPEYFQQLDDANIEVNRAGTGIFSLILMDKFNALIMLLGILSHILRALTIVVIVVLISTMMKIIISQEDGNNGIPALISTFFVVTITGTIASIFGSLSLRIFAYKFINQLRIKMLDTIVRQEISWFDQSQNATSILIGRLSIDPARVDKVVGIPLAEALVPAILTFAASIAVLVLSWFTGIFLFACIVIVIILQCLYSIIHMKVHALLKSLADSANKIAVESVSNIFVVKILGIAEHFRTMYRNELNKSFKLQFLMSFIEAILLGSTLPICILGCIFVRHISVLLLLVKDNADNTLFDSENIISQIMLTYMASVVFNGNVLKQAPDFQDAMTSANRILHILNCRPKEDNSNMIPEKIDPRLALENVQFAYPTRPSALVLQGISIDVPCGQTVAIVGPSGSGKSTVVSLIERFYDPLLGKILIGDYDIKDINISWIRRNTSLVSQEPVLFNMTIRENIAYGALHDNSVTQTEIVRAAEAANIHHFIESLAQGYDTCVGSKGFQLSGGQKQRIAIARAVLRKPMILLLDEATSSLDTENEEIVQEALNTAMKDCTTLIIAHRLSTVRNANMIIVMDKGEIVEQGTHSELISNQQGLYYRMSQY